MCRALWAVGPSEFLAAHEATAVTLTCQAHSIQAHMLPERRRSLALARAMIVPVRHWHNGRLWRGNFGGGGHSLTGSRCDSGRVLQLVIEEFVRPSASAARPQSSPALHSPLCPPLVCVRWCGSCIRRCAAWPRPLDGLLLLQSHFIIAVAVAAARASGSTEQKQRENKAVVRSQQKS